MVKKKSRQIEVGLLVLGKKVPREADLRTGQFKGHPAAKEHLWNVPNFRRVPEGLWSAHLKQKGEVHTNSRLVCDDVFSDL